MVISQNGTHKAVACIVAQPATTNRNLQLVVRAQPAKMQCNNERRLDGALEKHGTWPVMPYLPGRMRLTRVPCCGLPKLRARERWGGVMLHEE